ncbi:MAG: VacJ family lipoprotein [Desulfobacteraceae bacterium]|nr:MAG: VacJ family lipoprotein [Desulfobacteraceae bacterium]
MKNKAILIWMVSFLVWPVFFAAANDNGRDRVEATDPVWNQTASAEDSEAGIGYSEMSLTDRSDFMAFEEVPATAGRLAYADEPWPEEIDMAALGQEDEEDLYVEEPIDTIADPLEPMNRAFFAFNDKFYAWLLKPVTKVYKKVTPQKARTGIKNFFYNLGFPVRFVNCLLQFKGEGAGMEFGRFIVNSTIGLGGVMDVATESCQYKHYDEDFGQTLQFYGFGNGFYIDWPILGPSSLTDSIGAAGDSFLDPLKYAKIRSRNRLYVRALKGINGAGFLLDEYDALKDSALDPYIALRDAYYQYRQKKVKE